MNRQDRRDVSREYFSEDRLAEHHFRSFNAFLERGMQQVAVEKETIETDIGDKEGQEPVYVELGDIRILTPRVREADGSEELLFPQEARLRNITYAAPVFMEMSIVRGGEEEPETVVDSTETKVGRMPIMVGSDKCNIAEFSDEELIEIGEDPADPGGYFIVNGSERVLMTSEDLAPNKILAEHDTKYDDDIQVAKTFSQRRGYRALVLCERNREGLLEVSFPSVSGSVDFVTLVRALGLESDEEIVHRVSDDPEIVKFMLENLEEADVKPPRQPSKPSVSASPAVRAKTTSSNAPTTLSIAISCRIFTRRALTKRRYGQTRPTTSVGWPRPVSNLPSIAGRPTTRIITPTNA
jgi:DNA-directed RNA polymerase, subunit B" (EC 2.7.7.6)